MARTQYTVTFPAAKAGDEVTWPNTVKIYPDASTSRPLGNGYIEVAAGSFTGWSDAASVTFTRAGTSDSVTVTTGSPTGTGAAVPTAASGVSKGLLANRPAATGSGAAYYATDTGQLTVDIASGQWSSAPGADIADFIYAPVGGATYTTTSATFAAVDATNLVFTFIAPDSGVVWVDWTCSISNPAQAPHLGLIEGSTTVVEYGVGQNMADLQQRTFRFRVTGLTPGSSHTYKLAWAASSAGTVTIFTNNIVPVLVRVMPGK